MTEEQQTDQQKESDQLRQRRANFEELQRLGVTAYPHAFTRTDTVAELVEAHGQKTGEALEAGRIETTTAGSGGPSPPKIRCGGPALRSGLHIAWASGARPRRSAGKAPQDTQWPAESPVGQCFDKPSRPLLPVIGHAGMRANPGDFEGPMPIRAILFDKDGTLIDFQRTWGPATHVVLSQLCDGDAAAYERVAAVSLFDAAHRKLLPGSPVVIETTYGYGKLWAQALCRPLTKEFVAFQ